MLMISEIWLTDTPRIAGSICLSTRQTPVSRRFSRGSTSIPIFFNAGSWYSSCASPGKHTPGQGHDGWIKIRGEQHGKGDHGDVQQRRGEGRHRKTVPVLRIAPASEESEISNI